MVKGVHGLFGFHLQCWSILIASKGSTWVELMVVIIERTVVDKIKFLDIFVVQGTACHLVAQQEIVRLQAVGLSVARLEGYQSLWLLLLLLLLQLVLGLVKELLIQRFI